MNAKPIHEISAQSHKGELTFPEVVRGMLAAGVESYFVDFGARRTTHYLSNGAVETEPFELAMNPIAEKLNTSALLDAIRAAQADTVRYPEFVRLSTAAGVIGYWAFLTGERVIYFGRDGQSHTEEFPKRRP